jgi:hypothetical protein
MADTPAPPPIDRDSGRSMNIAVIVLAVALASFAVISETSKKTADTTAAQTKTEAPTEAPVGEPVTGGNTVTDN